MKRSPSFSFDNIRLMCALALALLGYNRAFTQSDVQPAKFIILDDTQFDLSEGDLTESTFRSEAKRRNSKAGRTYSNEAEFKSFSSELYEVIIEDLVDRGYVDTTDRFFPEYGNSVRLKVAINKIHVDFILPKGYTRPVRTYLTMNLDFEMKTYYGRRILSKSMNFEATSLDRELSLSEQIELRILDRLREFLSLEDVQRSIKDPGNLDAADEASFSEITLPHNADRSRALETWRSAVPTVIAPDGHGSACVISPDGYMITNFHVVEQHSSVRIKFADGHETIAEVVRRHPDCDLALLKADEKNLDYLSPVMDSAELGEFVYVIGTPADTLLGQSVSKGIVSGMRQGSSVQYIQTDAKVNPGNSGGAMVTEDGRLIGIVSSRYNGYGVEGIGFAIPASNVFQYLKVSVEKPVPKQPAHSTQPVTKGRRN